MPPLSVTSEDLLAQATLQATVDPISQGVGTVTTGWVNATGFAGGMFAVVQAGVLGAAATVDAKLQYAQDGSGTGAADIPGKAITQILKATGDNKQAVIRVPRWQIDMASSPGHPFVRLSITVGGAASLVAGALYGVGNSYGGQSVQLAGSVAQVVQ
jgi:hypothetical protein